MPPSWLPVALLGVVFLGEIRTWRDYRARAAPSAQDAGSFRVNNLLGWAAIAGGLVSGFLLRSSAFAIPAWLAWAGTPLALLGTGLRFWAVSLLGGCYSLTIQVRPGQPVIDRGPYRLIRHPSYAGGDLAFVGVGLAAGNWVSPILYVLPWLAAHAYRIRVEERALVDVLGDRYRAYQGRTWRLVPFVW